MDHVNPIDLASLCLRSYPGGLVFPSYGYHSGVSQLFITDARETAALRGFLHDGARQRMRNEGPETALKKLSLYGK